MENTNGLIRQICFIVIVFLSINTISQDNIMKTPKDIFASCLIELYNDVSGLKKELKELKYFDTVSAYMNDLSFYYANNISGEDHIKISYGEHGCMLKFEIFYPLDKNSDLFDPKELKELKNGEYYCIRTSIGTAPDADKSFMNTINKIFQTTINNIETGLDSLEYTETEKGIPYDLMGQKVVGFNLDGSMYDATGSYYQEAFTELRKGTEQALLKLMNEVFETGHASQSSLDSTYECFVGFNASTKGTSNFMESDYWDYINSKVQQFDSMFIALKKVQKHFETRGVTFTIEKPGEYLSWPYWNMGVIPGCNITINKTSYLYACIPVNAVTNDYLTLNRGPLAAHIVHINDDYILFSPANQDFDSTFLEVAGILFPKGKDVKDSVESCYNAFLFNNSHLIINTDKEYSIEELKKLKEEFSVKGIIVGNLGTFSAKLYIYTNVP